MYPMYRDRTELREAYFFLWRFFRSFFLRLWVAILCLFRFLPQGTCVTPSGRTVRCSLFRRSQ